jgi:hypothetical protein
MGSPGKAYNFIEIIQQKEYSFRLRNAGIIPLDLGDVSFGTY